jgi:hypothetical protein
MMFYILKQFIIYFKCDELLNKLVVNRDIICLGNKVFDLKECIFRETEQINSVTKEEIQIFEKVLQDIFYYYEENNIKSDFYQVIIKKSYFIYGQVLKQIFNIFMLRHVFGDYYFENNKII